MPRTTTLSKADLADLKRAKELLENPGLVAKFSSVLGAPMEKGMKMLPAKWQKSVHTATEAALMKALNIAISTMSDKTGGATHSRKHQFAVALTGAMGGAVGLPALALELPISTGVMLRSIAAIAASEGENPKHLDTKLACLTVFALGSTRDKDDDAAESGYFATRAALASAVSEASKYLAQKGLAKAGAPALVRLISLIGARFGVVVSEKAAAQSIPILGAAGGALLNTIFIGHYQDMARGHFIVRRLEKIHGAEPVRIEYEKL
jgi:EcsC protein family